MQYPEACFQAIQPKVSGFFYELQKLAKNASPKFAHAIIEQFKYANMPTHLKKSMNKTKLKNERFAIVPLAFEQKWELNGLEAADELQVNTRSQDATKKNSQISEQV